jgi:MraZ protein
MTSFLGEYEVAIDAKGRMLLPAGFRKQLPEGATEKFVVNRGFESCLTLYTMDVWAALSEKINKLNDFKPATREFKRLFLNGATMIEVDSAGRILLPKPLQEHAGIKKEAVLSAQGNKVELWDKDTYYNYIRQNAANFSKLAEDVANDFGNPFENL